MRLLQSGIISKEELLYKYTNEIFANEIVLLSYYIAAINIEETFKSALQTVCGKVKMDCWRCGQILGPVSLSTEP